MRKKVQFKKKLLKISSNGRDIQFGTFKKIFILRSFYKLGRLMRGVLG